MRITLIAIILFWDAFLLAQSDAPKALPQDPKTILDLAAPFYVYDAENAKPWHLSYHYRLLDEQGGVSGEGKVEYWWSTSKMTRVTWTKGSNVSSEWHTADGKTLKSVTGDDVTSMEHRLSSAVLFSFPSAGDYETGDWHLKLVTLDNAGNESLCVAVVSSKTGLDAVGNPLRGVGTAYCFDPKAPFLVSTLMNHTITNSYSKVQKFQNHNIAGHIDIAYLGQKKLEADLEDYAEVAPDDAAFTPSPDAKEPVVEVRTIPIGAGITPGMLLDRVPPVYPPDAKAAHIMGTVVVKAVIGKDGRVHDPEVVSSPDSSLSAAALEAVRQWQYRPYTLNGKPVEVMTHINVVFELGN